MLLSLFKNEKYSFSQTTKVKTKHLKARGADNLVFQFIARVN